MNNNREGCTTTSDAGVFTQRMENPHEKYTQRNEKKWVQKDEAKKKKIVKKIDQSYLQKYHTELLKIKTQ